MFADGTSGRAAVRMVRWAVAAAVVLGAFWFLVGRFVRRQDSSAWRPRAVVQRPRPNGASKLPLLATNEPSLPLPEAMPDAPDRMADARSRRQAHLTEILAAAGMRYPAHEVYLRGFKHEGLLELWARSAADAGFRLIFTYPIRCASGRLGPKRREGDGQVPEGFYTVDRFNPRSLFHLSLGLDYPNAADQRLTTDPAHPGSGVFIHGAAVSVGCLAMGDAAAEEIYLTARDAGASESQGPAVHLFPCRMNRENWQAILAPCSAGRPELRALWRTLQQGFDHFERTRQPLVVRVDPRGNYLVE